MKRWMTLLLGAVLLAAAASAAAETPQSQKLDDATSVLHQFVDIPENAIPKALLNQAYGIAVIPNELKIGFMFGGRHGSGVLSVRTAGGGWSNPAFINLTGGSFGWQIGASSTDIILVFKTRRSVEKIANGQFSLGADAAVAAGPIGRSAGAATNLTFKSEVYSYSRSRGLFAGVSVEGARLSVDHDDDWLFYNQAGLGAPAILRQHDHANIPRAGQRFVYTLDRYMPASGSRYRYSSNVNGAAAGQPGNAGQNGAGSDSYSQGQTRPYHRSAGSDVSVQQRTENDGSSHNHNNNGTGHDYGSGANRSD